MSKTLPIKEEILNFLRDYEYVQLELFENVIIPVLYGTALQLAQARLQRPH